MKLNKIELRKILNDFNSNSNRLLQADYRDFSFILRMYIKFLESVPIIHDYISNFGKCTVNVEEELIQMRKAYGHYTFDTGDTESEEVGNTFHILKYLVENDIDVVRQIAMGYSDSNSYQDIIKDFNNRFVLVLIRYIESYLTKIGIDMGVDERNIYNVTVNDGQVIIAHDNSVVTAHNCIEIKHKDFEKLANDIMLLSSSFSETVKEEVSDSLEVIKEEINKDTPRKSMIKTALATLKGIKGTVEFGLAIAEICSLFKGFL